MAASRGKRQAGAAKHGRGQAGQGLGWGTAARRPLILPPNRHLRDGGGRFEADAWGAGGRRGSSEGTTRVAIAAGVTWIIAPEDAILCARGQRPSSRGQREPPESPQHARSAVGAALTLLPRERAERAALGRPRHVAQRARVGLCESDLVGRVQQRAREEVQLEARLDPRGVDAVVGVLDQPLQRRGRACGGGTGECGVCAEASTR